MLCERCGYVVEGLPEDGPCPECGRPIADSLPERRTGTPWQRRSGVGAALATGLLVATQPKRTLDVMRVRPPAIGGLLAVSAFPIAWLCGAGVVLLLELERALPGGGATSWSAGSALGAWAISLALGVMLTPIVVALLWMLTWVEARGLVIFAVQHSFRVHPRLAYTITRHGAFGWLLCGAGALMALPLALASQADWRQAHGEPSGFLVGLALAGAVVAFVGFLGFELFAWLGLRRCKFANSHRPASCDA